MSATTLNRNAEWAKGASKGTWCLGAVDSRQVLVQPLQQAPCHWVIHGASGAEWSGVSDTSLIGQELAQGLVGCQISDAWVLVAAGEVDLCIQRDEMGQTLFQL
jgi:hypothetical protein